MDFSSWLAEQRSSITRLHVVEGEYVTRYLARDREYTAAPRATSTNDIVAVVEHVAGAVRVRLTVGGLECTFEPAWINRGLDVRRLLPARMGAEDARNARGRALAALRSAAERVFDDHHDRALGLDTPADQHAEMQRLARGPVPPVAGDDLAAALAQSIATKAA